MVLYSSALKGSFCIDALDIWNCHSLAVVHILFSLLMSSPCSIVRRIRKGESLQHRCVFFCPHFRPPNGFVVPKLCWIHCQDCTTYTVVSMEKNLTFQELSTTNGLQKTDLNMRNKSFPNKAKTIKSFSVKYHIKLTDGSLIGKDTLPVTQQNDWFSMTVCHDVSSADPQIQICLYAAECCFMIHYSKRKGWNYKYKSVSAIIPQC